MSELHSLAALRQAADHLRAEEQHWWADVIMAAIETLASEDRASEQIERVRDLHRPMDVDETLYGPEDYATQEVALEGYPDMDPHDFVQRFFVDAQGMSPADAVTRIEWRYLDGAES